MIDNPTLQIQSRPGRSASRHRPFRALAVVALVGMALTFAACSSSGSTTTTTGGASSSVPTTAGGGGGGGAATDAIVIKNFAFSPASITVKPGATVTVTNKDSVAHTVTASNGGFNTGDIQPGASATFTAPNSAGSYPYICSIHQYMTGTLIVSS